ncbi:hypothetical protein ABIA16_001731 [Sinorhizobium fredii]
MSAITIKQIIKDAGGPDAIAQASSKVGGDISKDAVYKWGKTGIPDRHWPVIIALTSCRPEDLYAANCAARGLPTDVLLPDSEPLSRSSTAAAVPTAAATSSRFPLSVEG